MKLNSFAPLSVALLCVAMCAQVQSPTPQPTLQQYVADLQRNPSDNALREKIIKLAQGMNPPPAIPEAGREHYVMAATFIESAKDKGAYERAIEHYKAALLEAPWWADAYKKLAFAQKAAGHYDDAISSLNFYLLAQPADARDAQDEIYKLKALKISAAEDDTKRRAEEQAKSQQDAQEDSARRLLGEWCPAQRDNYDICIPYPPIDGRMHLVISRSISGYAVRAIDLAGQGDVACTSVSVNGDSIHYVYTFGSSVMVDLTATSDGRHLHGTAQYYSNGQWVAACTAANPCMHYVRVR